MIRAVRLLNLRRILRQPLRAGLAAVAVAAGVSLAVCTPVVSGSLTHSFATFGRTFAGPAPLRVVGATARGGLDEGVVATVERTPGVAASLPVVQAVTLADRVEGRARRSRTVLGLGLDCRVEAFLGAIGCSPEAVAAARDTDPPILSARLSRWLGANGQIRNDFGSTPVAGAPSATRLDGLNGGRVAVFPLPVAQRLFARPHQVDAIYVKPQPGTDVQVLRSRLQRAVGPWNGVLLATDPPPGARVALGTFLPLFGLLAIFSVAIASVLVYDVISLSIEERRRDLAVVAAVGGSSRVVVGGTMLEGAALGLAGGLVGAVGALLLARPITASISGFTEKFVGIPFTVHVSALPFVVGALMGILIGAAATWLPARRAMRMDVAAELSNRGLRDEQAPRPRIRRGLVWLTLGFAGLGACWLGQRDGSLESWQLVVGQLGVLVASVAFLVATSAFAPAAVRAGAGLVRRSGAVARLSLANLVREPGRTGTMTVAVGTPVATAFIISSFIIAIHAGVTHGVLKGTAGKVRVSTVAVNNTLNVDAKVPPDTITALGRLPGVASVDRAAALLTGHRVKDLVGVVAFEHPTLPFTIIKGTKDRSRFERGEALIGPGLARRRHLRPGDDVRLPTPTGWASVRVQGIWQNGDFNGSSVTVPFPMLERLYGPQPAQEVYLRPAAGVAAGRLVTEVRRAGLGPTVQVQSPRRLADLISRDIKSQFASFWALQRAMLLVAFVAVLSTLLLVGIQRRRELALLAAVGMRPDELARMVLAEGIVVAVVGTVFSALAGLAMFTAFHQMVPVLVGFRDPFRLDPRAIVLYGAVATVIVLLAASWPAWRAARLEVVEALQYE